MTDEQIEIDIEEPLGSRDLRNYISEFLNSLHESCPTSSFISFKLKKEAELIVGALEVNSPSMILRSKFKNDSVESVLLQLFDDVEKKIRRWRALRFMPHSTRS